MTFTALRAALLGCAVAWAGAAIAQPRTQTTEDDNSRLWAKVANERAKASVRKSDSRFKDPDGRCGSVDIGNVDTGGSRRAPREVVTIVTGDVINAPGRCK